MKKLNLIKHIATLALLTGIFIPSFAQSDYEIVKNFQQRYHQIEEKIHSSKNLEELNSLIVEIDRLRNDYIDHKTLLDRGLYPENFDSSLEKLEWFW